MPLAGHQIIRIDSLNDPRIADYANLRDRQLRQSTHICDADEQGAFMAEGELVVRTLLKSPLSVKSVLLTPQRLSTMEDALAALSPFTPIFLTEQPVMNQIVGFNIHRGILAAGVRPKPPNLDDLLPRVRTLVLLENLANHDNVGGLFRAAAALAGLPSPLRSFASPPSPPPEGEVSPQATEGAPSPPAFPTSTSFPPIPSPSTSSSSIPLPPGEGGRRRRPGEGTPPSGAAILLSPHSCDPLYRKAIRVSMGAALLLPFATLEPWPAALADLKGRGFTLIALTPDPGATDLRDLRIPAGSRPALLLGAEGPGLSPAALAHADVRVRIPIDPRIDSLNVVTAGAIALHALQPDRPNGV